jgi:hypothetical protein
LVNLADRLRGWLLNNATCEPGCKYYVLEKKNNEIIERSFVEMWLNDEHDKL